MVFVISILGISGDYNRNMFRALDVPTRKLYCRSALFVRRRLVLESKYSVANFAIDFEFVY